MRSTIDSLQLNFWFFALASFSIMASTSALEIGNTSGRGAVATPVVTVSGSAVGAGPKTLDRIFSKMLMVSSPCSDPGDVGLGSSAPSPGPGAGGIPRPRPSSVRAQLSDGSFPKCSASR